MAKKRRSRDGLNDHDCKQKKYDEIIEEGFEEEDDDLDEEEVESSSRSGIDDILWKLPKVSNPLNGTPQEVQEELDNMALYIQNNPNCPESDELYNKIFVYMHGYLINVALKQFPYIKGMQTNDIFQECLIALRMKAIPGFKTGKGMSFLNFAKMCIRRHMITILNASRYRQKDQSMNRAVSIDRPIDDDSNNTFMSVLHDDSDPADKISEDKEAFEVTKSSLSVTLSEFERMVFQEYLAGGSYKEIARNISKKTNEKCKQKAVDNALWRIRQKASSLKEDNDGSPLPLFM